MSKDSKAFFDPMAVDQSTEANLGKTFLKAVGWTLGFLALFVIVTAIGLGIFAYRKIHTVAVSASVSERELLETARAGWKHELTDQSRTILLLGKDELPTRGNAPVLTDTIMVVSLRPASGQVDMFSLPRDLWIPEYKTKVNALYHYGKEKYPAAPEQFPKEVISSLIGIPIERTIVLDMAEVGQIIDTIGGLQIDIPTGFVDTQFPRPDVDVTVERDPAKLYQTVEFRPGLQILSGERVLQYIRSRHADGEQGTDVARAQRQQLVISSLLEQMKDPNYYSAHLAETGALYRFYLNNFTNILSPEEVIALGKQVVLNGLDFTFQSGSPSIFPENPSGALVHPQNARPYQNQWVYTVKDEKKLKEEAANSLN